MYCYKAVAGVPILTKDDKPTLKGEWRMPEFRLLLTNYGELTHCKNNRGTTRLLLVSIYCFTELLGTAE